MLVKLVEVYKHPGERVRIDEIFVAKEAVTSIRAEQGAIINEAIEFGISEHAGFSRVTLNEGGMARTITVVGSPTEVRNKLGIRTVLRG
jgi:hypothetical protein